MTEGARTPDRRRARVSTPALVALLLVALVACTGLPATPDPSGVTRAPGTSAPPPPPVLTVEDALAALTEAGIPVFEDPTDTRPIGEPAAPVSPYALLRFQVEQLARDATAGGGVPADEIDDLIPMPPGTAAMSAMIAGYVATGQTPGSRAAARLMADQDLERTPNLWFPTIVLTLFVGEVAGAAAALAPEGAVTASLRTRDDGGFDADMRPVAADPCGDFSRFFGRIIGSISDAILSVIPRIPFIGAAIDWALGKLADAAKELLGQVPFLKALRQGVTLLALAATVVTSLRDWPVSVTADPGAEHHSVGATVGRMTMTAFVDDGPGDLFSVPVRNCASLLGIDLPRGGVRGSAVAWRILEGAGHMASGLEQDAAVDVGKHAKFAFDLVDESERDHAEGAEAAGLIRVEMTLRRQDVEQVRTLIRGFITGAIPAVVWDAVVGQFGDPIAKLTTWADPKGLGRGVVSYHLPPDATPRPSEEPPASQPPQPPTGAGAGEFCRQWRAYIEWARENEESDIDRTLAAAIVMWFQGMRRVAPPEMVTHVDAVIWTYRAFAEAPDEMHVPLSGQGATAMYEGLLAIDAHCATNAFQ